MYVRFEGKTGSYLLYGPVRATVPRRTRIETSLRRNRQERRKGSDTGGQVSRRGGWVRLDKGNNRESCKRRHINIAEEEEMN